MLPVNVDSESANQLRLVVHVHEPFNSGYAERSTRITPPGPGPWRLISITSPMLGRDGKVRSLLLWEFAR